MTKRIDINSASENELKDIRGIGPQKARDIIEFRRLGARFDSVDDLVSATKLGTQYVEDLRKTVRFGGVGAPTDNAHTVRLVAAKQQGEGYDGFELAWELHLKRPQGRFTRNGRLELGRENEVTLTAETGEVIESVEASVRTPEGHEVTSRSARLDELLVEDGTATFHFALPVPDTERYEVLLVEPDDGAEEASNQYVDHSLVISFDVLEPETRNVQWRDERTFPIEADGTADVHLTSYGIVDRLEFEVRAPTGEVLSRRVGSVDEFGALDPIEIPVPPRETAGGPGTSDSLPERPAKALCRLVDPSGERVYSDVQVVFYTATVESPDPDMDFSPTIVARSENNGYFVVDLPHQSYTGAFARVGVAQGPHAYVDIPVRLDEAPVTRVVDGEVVVETGGFFPGRILLVVESDAAGDDECDCETCGEVDFHKVRPVLEEFSYYTVVRTTEPTIQGYVLDEDGEMTVQEVLDLVPVVGIKPKVGIKGDIKTPIAALGEGISRETTIRKDVLLQYINGKKGLTPQTLQKAVERSNALKLRKAVVPRREVRARGRQVLNLDNAIDWDEDPTIYQATSLAHGHLLQFKQEWISDGYSLGDLAYSLPLAPGQKKQVVVLDWEARAAATRTEGLDYRESLANNLGRDRDVSEIVRGTLRESVRGGSSASTGAAGGGLGLGGVLGTIGGLLGVAGGSSKASSQAWQKSARDTTLSSSQSLRDRTSQAASAVRSMRGTVVATTTEGEQFSVTTEVVANYNHCHSLTIQYFEVLRHLRVEQRLAGVQECLFVPLMLSPFDFQKVLRWRESLESALPNPPPRLPRVFVLDRGLREGFDAIERIENDYEGSDLPEGTYADANIGYIEGELHIDFRFGLPAGFTWREDIDELRTSLASLSNLFPGHAGRVAAISAASVRRLHEIFAEDIAPEMAAALIENLEVYAVTESTDGSAENEALLPLDPTLLSRYRSDVPLHVALRQDGALPPLPRRRIKAIVISKASEIRLSDGETTLADRLPPNSSVIIRSGSLRYRTAYASGHLFKNSRINDDLIGYNQSVEGGGADRVRVATPLSRSELRNPRNEDLERANQLQDHLNDNLERYHRAIWMQMSPERRFMFLDGIQVTDYSEKERYPGGVVRSVASVVENEVIGVVGNSLVMPVAPGFRLDPNTRGADVDLLSLYRPPTPMDPMRVSLPTKGVFAEAVMGRCNSCERIREDRFWRWSEEPIPDQPTSILPVSAEERGGDIPDTTPTPFPNPIINLQNAPAAPDPQGVTAAAQLLSNPNLFRDVTGLTENQRNALAALQLSMSAAQNFGQQAASLAKLGTELKAISDARKENLLSDESATKLAETAVQKHVDGDEDRGLTGGGVEGILRRAEESDRAEVRVRRTGAGTEESVDVTYDSDPTGDGTAGDTAPEGDGREGSGVEDGTGSEGGASEPRPRPQPRTTEYFRVLSPTQVLFLNFPVGEAELGPRHLPYVRQVLERVDGPADVKIIQGHASRTGSDEDNLDLSRRRARSLLAAFEEHTQLTWPSGIVAGTAEDAPTVRSLFGAKLQDIAGKGEPEDPVERSVVLEFVAPTFEQPEPSDETGSPSTAEPQFTDNRITIGDTDISVHQDNSVTVFNHVTRNDTTLVDNSSTVVHNTKVILDGNQFVIDGRSFRIEDGKLRKENDGTVVPGDPATTQWEVFFRTPTVAEGENVFDLVQRIAEGVLLNEVNAPASPPDEEPAWWEDIDSAATGAFDSAVDAIQGFVLQQLMRAVGRRLRPVPILTFIRIGKATVPATLRNGLSGEELDGVFTGNALSFDTGSGARAVMVLNDETFFSTSTPRTLASWRGEKPEILRLALQPIGAVIVKLLDALEFAAHAIEHIIGINIYSQLKAGLDASLLEYGSLDRLYDTLQGGQIHFLAEPGDRPYNSPYVFAATPASHDVTAIFFGVDGCSFETG